VQVYRTGQIGSQFITCLLYGLAGAGKTPLLASLPDPIIVCSEPGLLSLRQYNLPYIVARDYKENIEAINWLANSKEATKYQSVGYDSISATSENILIAEKKRSRDPRQFSPATFAATMEVVMGYMAVCEKRRHLVMTCKAVENVDKITGIKTAEPSAVVPKLGPALPYHFDTVLNVSRFRDPQSGVDYAALRCGANDYCIARDRSGKLGLWEIADFSHIIQKINT
jgi:hypothetical protein